MKKFIVFAVVMALLVPTLATAATEFSLGGFIKMDMMWDSDSGVGKNINAVPTRNNDPNLKHGRLKFTAQGSRFNFTIKGPDLWGAKTSGFIEIDMDSSERGTLNLGNFSASNNYTPRMRHAMFRFNWPTSELLFGQYFSMFCEYYAESAEDGPLQLTGTPTARLAQVRFTQKFMQDWTVAALIGDPNQTTLNQQQAAGPYFAAINNGQAAETPQVQGKVSYAHDFWGKAAYYGKPTPFTIQFVGGWQRSVIRGSNPGALGFAGTSFGEGNLSGFVPGNNINVQNTYVNPWMAMGSLFIPVIPTQSANLAGTASILTQWWIGQGVEAFGFTGVTSNLYRYQNGANNMANYDAELLKKFGGFVQGQYYFNNQWFVNALYGVSKTMDVSRARYIRGGMGAATTFPIGANEIAFVGADNASTIQQAEFTLWYRPIQAIKFGLQYAYTAASYAQMTTVPGGLVAGVPAGNGLPAATSTPNTTRYADDHRVEFVGFFYF